MEPSPVATTMHVEVDVFLKVFEILGDSLVSVFLPNVSIVIPAKAGIH
jgi:hypothetical protein